MTITPDEFQKLKDRQAELTQVRDRAAGALAELKKRLWDEFRCRTLEQARAKLKQETARHKKLERKYRAKLASLIREFGDAGDSE